MRDASNKQWLRDLDRASERRGMEMLIVSIVTAACAIFAGVVFADWLTGLNTIGDALMRAVQ